MSRASSTIARAGVAVLALACGAGVAQARPTYFDNFKAHYGVAEASNLDTCGVCHFRFTGSGARNSFGTSVEQQLYLGKSVVQSLTDVENADSDGDGFTNAQEIIDYMTLPGFNCDNFMQAVGAPAGYDTYITPLVDSCLEPLDIRVSPDSAVLVALVGKVKTFDIAVYNNGSENPLQISSYELVAGAPASLSLSGPAAPLSIPVGGSEIIQIVFAPASAAFSDATLRIFSDDPDEPTLDLPITAISTPDATAEGALRAPCFETIGKAMARYTKAHLREWNRCYLEELAGRACDTGARELRLAKAAEKLAAVIGGAKDKTCAGAGLTRASLGFPTQCSGGCSQMSVSSISNIGRCLQCVQDEVMTEYLRAGIGTGPPDLPPNVIAGEDAFACQERILRDLQKGMARIYASLNECELAAVLADAEEDPDCLTAQAAQIAELRATVDASVDKCLDTTGLLGCRFEGMDADPLCLGNAAEDLASELSQTTFGTYGEE
ncbi:MAG TPA: hypothetical protein VEC57_01005 [Candidatus Limnocylindrales bacterium]|nr:hypothetical protein [Candidatus Limnocylindrales bacterium]